MENKKLNREWVKTAAIILLSVLLVLTFFSNTILNISLPEVASAAVSDGTITAKVKGTGTVSAIGNTEIKSKNTTTVASVKAKEGAEVNAGDVLFIMGESSEELEAAQNELDSLRFSLQRYYASYPTTASSTSYDRALEKYQSAKSAYDQAKDTYEKYAADSGIDNAKKTLSDTESAMNLIISQENEKRNTYYKKYEDAKSAYDAIKDDETIPQSEKDAKKSEMDAAFSEYNSHTAQTAEETAAINNYENARKTYDAMLNALEYSEYKQNYQNAKTAFEAAESAYYSARDAYDASIESSSQSASATSVNIMEVQSQIAKAEKKVAELSGGEDNAIVAPVAGTIASVSVSPGASVAKNDVLCVIEVPDMGYQMSFSVTNDQAKRIKVGDSATVSNYYWGSEIVATVSSIKVDPKNSQTNKLITFTLDGDVSNGSQLTISVGEKSANYDVVVPNSAIRNDANGSFVLAIDASRSNALGNRYFAKRVAVEVLASDDNNSAVSGDISYGDFVITTSSSPIKSGDQVRLADSING